MGELGKSSIWAFNSLVISIPKSQKQVIHHLVLKVPVTIAIVILVTVLVRLVIAVSFCTNTVKL